MCYSGMGRVWLSPFIRVGIGSVNKHVDQAALMGGREHQARDTGLAVPRVSTLHAQWEVAQSGTALQTWIENCFLLITNAVALGRMLPEPQSPISEMEAISPIKLAEFSRNKIIYSQSSAWFLVHCRCSINNRKYYFRLSHIYVHV